MGICVYYKHQIINEELKININEDKQINDPNVSEKLQEEIIKQESKSYLKYVKTKILGSTINENVVNSTENINENLNNEKNQNQNNIPKKPKSIIKHRMKQNGGEIDKLSNNSENNNTKQKTVKIKTDDQSIHHDPNNNSRKDIIRKKKPFQTVKNPKEFENENKLYKI